MALTELEQKLLDALVLAQEHLEFCGYGDNYEREIAKSIKLA